MHDKIIISIISKTYFSIVSFFIFIFLILSLSFITLQNGLFIQKIHIQNIELDELYIKWNEKIDISIKQLIISQSKSKESTKVNSSLIRDYLLMLSNTTNWFNSIIIETITYDTTAVGSFKYKNDEKGFLLVHAKNIDMNASIYFDQKSLVFHLNSLKDKKRDIKLYGDAYFDARDAKVYIKLHSQISDDASFDVLTQISQNKLKYKIQSNHTITNTKHIIDILELPKNLYYWVYKAISMSSLEISDIHGYIEYNKLKDAYKNVNITSTIKHLIYKYNPKLDPITSSYTTLNLRNGILYVRPYNAYTYNTYLDKSWLTVDFTKKEELLTLYLLFDASINKNILNILRTYRIKLPFIQNSGVIQTDLTLELYLQSLDVDVQGNFFANKANIDYMGLNIDVFDSYITLNNNDITIKKMRAYYNNIATADVTAKYNAKTNKGKINFLVNTVALGNLTLQKPINVTYNVQTGKDTIHLAHSQWNFNSKKISVNSMTMPFDIKTLQLLIPPTKVQLENISHASVSGTVNLNTTTALLDANILDFSYDGINLSKADTHIKILYNKYFSFHTAKAIYFSIAGTQYKANKVHIDIQNDTIYLKHTLLNIGKYITTKIYANYNTLLKKSHVSLNDFVLIDPNTKTVLYENPKILLGVTIGEEVIKVSSQELEAEFISKENAWKLYLHSIGKIARNSDLLKKYHVKEGTFNIYKNKTDTFIRFKSKIVYPYKILVKANKPLSDYKLKGKIYKEKISLMINNIVHINIKDTISITANNCAININEVLHAIGDINSTKNTQKNLLVSANFKNSYLYINKHKKVLYDIIYLKFTKDILSANLDYNHAHAHLRLKNNQIHLYGSNFNDNFMNKLFSLTRFKKGLLDFSVTGDIHDYNGVFYIRDTTLKDYKVLNNILAFVNTVPSLITFSLPGYNKNGLYIDKSYVKFNYKNKKFYLSDIYLDSKEIDIFGTGIADIPNNHINLVLNLKTDLASDLSKIPLVGYILFNDDSISTTLNVKGKLTNPEVRSLLAKEIIVAPFNIIKRTLLLPYKLFKSDK